jgi:hypothetical protein
VGFVGWGQLLVDVALSPFLHPIEQAVQDGLEAERAAVGRISCGLRVLSGTHPGLSSMWRSGSARLGPGTIAMTSNLVVRVLDVDRSEQRRPKLWEQYGIDIWSTIVRVRTEDAMLEWSVRPKFLDWAAGVVSLPVAPSD